MYNYTDRIVVFADILGFKNIVFSSISDYKNLQKIEKALKLIQQTAEELKTYKSEELDTEVCFFTDSFVLSWIDKGNDSFFYILSQIIYLQQNLILNNLLLRGGIAKGNLIHKGSVIYGPALIKAVELEGKQAKYPRIIIEPCVIESLPNVKYDKEFNMNLLKKDSNDNYYYTDFIGQCDDLDYQYEFLLFINKMQETIKYGLKMILIIKL